MLKGDSSVSDSTKVSSQPQAPETYQHYAVQHDGDEIRRNLKRNNYLLFQNHNPWGPKTRESDSSDSGSSESEESSIAHRRRSSTTANAYKKTTRNKNKTKLMQFTK